MKYFCTLLLLAVSLWSHGQSNPLAARVTELEGIVGQLVDRIETLKAINRVLAAERRRQSQGKQLSREVNVVPDKKAESPIVAPTHPNTQLPLMAVTPKPEVQTQRLSASPTPPLPPGAAALVPSLPLRPLRARARASTRTYYRGSLGGCYYLNSSGNKTYVDRSMCH